MQALTCGLLTKLISWAKASKNPTGDSYSNVFFQQILFWIHMIDNNSCSPIEKLFDLEVID